MSEDGASGGGALGNTDMQAQIAQLLQSLGSDQTESTVKTEQKRSLPNQTDTSSKSESSSSSSRSAIDPGNPSLPPPNVRASNDGGNQSFSGNGEAKQLDPSSGIQVAEGTEITDDTQQLIDFSKHEAGVKALYELAGQDAAKTLSLLNEYFDEQGISTPVPATHRKMAEAAQFGLTKLLADEGISNPENKAELVMAGTMTLRSIVTFSDKVASVSVTPETTMNSPGNIARLDGYLGGTEALVGQIVKELKAGTLPTDGSQMAILDYLKFIADLVAELRVVLANLSFKDSEHSGKVAQLITQMNDAKRASLGKKFDKMWEKMELMKAMDYIEHFMGILNPIMGSTTILVAMVLLPINPVIGAILLAVAITYFVVTTTLQQTGKMDDLFREINALIESSLGALLEEAGVSENASEGWARAIFWIGLITIAVAAIAVLSIAPMIGAIIPAVITPILMTILSESGVLELIMEQFQKLTGLNDIWTAVLTGVLSMVFSFVIMGITEVSGFIREIATLVLKIIFEIVLAVIVIVIKAIVSVLTAGVGAVLSVILAALKIVVTILKGLLPILQWIAKAAQTIMEKLQGVAELAANVVKKVLDASVKLANAVQTLMKWLETSIKKMKEIFDKFLDQLDEVSDKIKNAVDQVKDTAFVQGVQKLREIMKKVKGVLDKLKEKADDIALQAVTLLDGGTRAAHTTTQAAVSAALGGLTLKLSEITKEEGEIEYLISLLTGLIKQLQAMMDKMLGKHSGGSDDEFMSQVKSLAKMFEQLMQSMSSISDELAASAVV